MHTFHYEFLQYWQEILLQHFRLIFLTQIAGTVQFKFFLPVFVPIFLFYVEIFLLFRIEMSTG